MLARLKRSLPRGRFIRNLSMLSGGFMLGQMLIVASSPVLSRLFTPAEFGVYAVFTALSGIFGNVVSLRYELAVPIVRREQDAAGLIGVSLIMAVASCLVLLAAIWLAGDWLAEVTNMPLLASLLWLLPLSVVMLSASETLSYWSIYRGTFRLNALTRLVGGATQAGAQIGLGLWGVNAAGLVAGYGLGFAARLVHLLSSLPLTDRRLLFSVRLRKMLWLIRRHWHYPAYSAPSTLLEAGTQLVPALLLAALYGPTVAGWFSLGQRLMGLPIRLFAQAARQVFLGEAAKRDRVSLYRLFRRSSLMFLGLGLAGMLPVLLAGPLLFAWVFGEEWRPAGEMVQYLVPLYLARFVVTPVSQTLNILGRQNLHLVSSSADALLLLATFLTAWWLALPPLTTVLLFSLGSTTAYSLYYVMAWRVARGQARTV